MSAAGIYARESTVLDRYVQIGVVGSKVVGVSFPESPDDGAGDDHPLLDRIFAYLDGEPDEFDDVEVGLTLSTDARAVLDEVRTIPYGETVTIEAVARSTAAIADVEEGVAVVREALHENPTPLLVPDHRVRDGPSGAPAGVVEHLRDIERGHGPANGPS